MNAFFERVDNCFNLSDFLCDDMDAVPIGHPALPARHVLFVSDTVSSEGQRAATFSVQGPKTRMNQGVTGEAYIHLLEPSKGEPLTAHLARIRVKEGHKQGLGSILMENALRWAVDGAKAERIMVRPTDKSAYNLFRNAIPNDHVDIDAQLRGTLGEYDRWFSKNEGAPVMGSMREIFIPQRVARAMIASIRKKLSTPRTGKS